MIRPIARHPYILRAGRNRRCKGKLNLLIFPRSRDPPRDGLEVCKAANIGVYFAWAIDGSFSSPPE